MKKIAYLYYDLLNLYGESGNIKALDMSLKSLDVEYTIDKLTITDDLEFSNYDFVYLGSGSEENEQIVLEHLKKYKEDIIKYVDSGKIMLVTGNTLALFTNSIINEKSNKKEEGLGLINADSKILEKNIVCETLCKSSLFENEVLGFQNRPVCLENFNDDNTIFEIIHGTGMNKETNLEGIKINNFYATFLIGPLLIRNPEVLKYFVDLILKDERKRIKNKIKALDLEFENKAYETFKKNYYTKDSNL